MAEWKSIVGKYVTFGEKKDHWTCNLCLSNCTGHRNRVIAHLTRNPGNGVKICQKITPELVEELKRALGLGPDSTGADGQPPQQPGDNDDIRQENGNKKRKSLSGSGSSQREAEMSPSGALNPSSALDESISVSDVSTRSPENLEKSIGATGLRLDNPGHNSPFSASNLSIFPPETWDAPMMALSETSHDHERAYVPNTDNSKFQGTNAVGSFGLFSMIHRGQSSSQGQVDHRNDQHTHPYKSTLRNAFGVEMASGIVVADESQPPCPPGFNPDSWELYLDIDKGAYMGKFSLYTECMSSTDEEERKVLWRLLESACSEVRNYLASAPCTGRNMLQGRLHVAFLILRLYCLDKTIDKVRLDVEETEKELREETEQGIEMLLRKRNNDTNRWVGYAASLKSDNDDLNVAARKVRSLEDTLQLLSRASNTVHSTSLITRSVLLKKA